MLRCPRCRADIPVRKLVASLPEGNAADDVLVNEQAPTDHVSAANSPGTEPKSKVARRRYYSRTRLPKNVTSVKRRRRRKPKTKVTGGDFVKVVLGGLVAFPVAQAILWWGFHRDPFSLGPSVASAVPFVVPRTFRSVNQEFLLPPPDYIANPESSLLQGNPFRFERIKNQNSNSIKETSPILDPAPMKDKSDFRPIDESNDKATPPQ